jgi:hypothetical protein
MERANRTSRFTLRFTPDELAAIERAARRAHYAERTASAFSLGDWMRAHLVEAATSDKPSVDQVEALPPVEAPGPGLWWMADRFPCAHILRHTGDSKAVCGDAMPKTGRRILATEELALLWESQACLECMESNSLAALALKQALAAKPKPEAMPCVVPGCGEPGADRNADREASFCELHSSKLSFDGKTEVVLLNRRRAKGKGEKESQLARDLDEAPRRGFGGKVLCKAKTKNGKPCTGAGAHGGYCALPAHLKQGQGRAA